MENAIEVARDFVYADVFQDLSWFANEFGQCPSIKFEEGGDGVPQELCGRQFVFEPRIGQNVRTHQQIAGILIYEIKTEGQEGEHFATISRAFESTDDPEVVFEDTENMIAAESVETMLLVAQMSVIEFRGELDEPKVVH